MEASLKKLMKVSKYSAMVDSILIVVSYHVDDIKTFFMQFGSLSVDWPHKNHSRACIPPKGKTTGHLHLRLKFKGYHS